MGIKTEKINGLSTEMQNNFAQLDASKLKTTLIPDNLQPPVPGLQDHARSSHRLTTAHMLQVPWEVEKGWGTPVIGPYGKIALEPTASVLHYATETFEGMKVFRGHDGKLRLFRPQLNCERLLQSNAQVSLPDFDCHQLLALITSFLALECPRWLPDPGSSLYIRPAMIGSGPALALGKPPEALFFLFAVLFPQSPPGPSTGIKLLTNTPDHIRAWPGGFGSMKVGASYGPALKAQGRALGHGCSQTLWLFGEDRLITEAGASNFIIIWRHKVSGNLELVTSALDLGVVLNGITRRSILELARKRLPELRVSERTFSMDEVIEAHAEGRLVEAFVSGTALFVLPVAGIKDNATEIPFPNALDMDGLTRPVAKYSSILKSWLEGIIFGDENHEWAYVIEENC